MMLFAWQAQGSCFAMSMFEVSDAESVERLQISCCRHVPLRGSFRVAVTGVRMPRPNFFVAGAVLLQHPLQIMKKGIGILKSNAWSTCHF